MVCVGNICRSPTAEFLLRDRLGSAATPSDDIRIASAGLSAMVGYPMESTAAQVLHEHGVDGSAHRARQLTPALLQASDLVLVMEKSHAAAISRMAPEASGKVFLLGKWQDDTPIPDPYGQQRAAFDHVHALIERGVDAWLPHFKLS